MIFQTTRAFSDSQLYIRHFGILITANLFANHVIVDFTTRLWIGSVMIQMADSMDWTPKDLVAFEKRVAEVYEQGLIKSPVHLSGGSERQLIEIFKGISRDDWKLCTWRNHLHALLSEIPPEEVMRQILAGKSMTMNSAEHKFYSSSIAGGILPIAVGLGMAIKRVRCDTPGCCHCRCKDLRCTTLLGGTEHGGHVHYNHLPCPAWARRVWCFCGDMTAECGIFWESAKYARNFNLPVTFIIESNGKSVQTPTEEIWGAIEDWSEYFYNVRRYEYELAWPHHGVGKFIELPF